MDPLFLSLDEVLFFHREQIARYGGTEGVRDLGLLQSALAQPQAMLGGEYLHADTFEMAAAYLFHIVRNHPFVDANKRVGLEAALAFLELNGFSIVVDQEALADMVLSVAEGRLDKAGIAEFLRAHAARES
ncbi:MAG TPA: type II toxin-antitoxin system death-on-curing family toxin [Candidatus Hydrogenedentes bacterium]|nr:type II toxin-antitoxin system death-on-curing family toxin [Candidatus Hydrogenedentota bacterium]